MDSMEGELRIPPKMSHENDYSTPYEIFLFSYVESHRTKEKIHDKENGYLI